VFPQDCGKRGRIAVEPGKCGDKPCIRGMRIRAIDVLDLLSNDLSYREILQELTDLGEADIRAAILLPPPTSDKIPLY
jgi:uncharacterized protein (DUF433 family)